MRSVNQYLHFSTECLLLARQRANAAKKAILEEMATVWQRLAEQRLMQIRDGHVRPEPEELALLSDSGRDNPPDGSDAPGQ
jgi:hypothetical protein